MYIIPISLIAGIAWIRGNYCEQIKITKHFLLKKKKELFISTYLNYNYQICAFLVIKHDGISASRSKMFNYVI